MYIYVYICIYIYIYIYIYILLTPVSFTEKNWNQLGLESTSLTSQVSTFT